MRGRQYSCCFTGHRPGKLPWGYAEEDPRCRLLKERIADAVEGAYQEGFQHFLCGMAMGCDLYFCEAVLELRSRHPDVTVEAAIPRRMPGRRTSGSGTGAWCRPVILRRWSPSNIQPAACSVGTGTWWITPRC